MRGKSPFCIFISIVLRVNDASLHQFFISMKKYLFFLLFFSLVLNAASQNDSNFICHYGFTFEISMQRSWGYGKPIVLTVSPNTSADAAGVKVGDIIEKINDEPTEGKMLETIITWLQNPNNNQVQLTLSNLEEKSRNVMLNKYCQITNCISEKDLAGVYAFYSLENSQTRMFTCPFEVTVAQNVNLANYKTFGFPEVDPQNEALEDLINRSITKSLESKGLQLSGGNPDLLIQTYYTYNRNPNYRRSSNLDKFPVETRYNMNTKTWERLPIYFNPLIGDNQTQYYLKLGITLVDNKRSSGENIVVVWEIESNELLQTNYKLEDYAEFHIPLMLMNYPYVKKTKNISYYYQKNNYNYTGLKYDINDLKEIADLDDSSPAEKAGLRPGDIVLAINGTKFVSKPKTADSNYKQFIFRTMNLRDEKTRFVNAEGFTNCMYWDPKKYVQISEEFKKPDFSTAFSYLFYFEPYINLSETNIVTFTIQRGKTKEDVKIKPVRVTEESFEVRNN